MPRLKVLFITCIPAFYRMEFFNLLGKECDLTVLFTEKTEWSKRNPAFFRERATDFRAVSLRGFRLFGKLPFLRGYRKLFLEKFDRILIADYASVMGVRIAEYMIRHKISYGIEIDGAFPKEGNGWKEKIKRRIVSHAEYWLGSGPVSDRYFLRYGARKERIYHYPFSSVRERDLAERVPTAAEKTALKAALGIAEPLAVVTVGAFIPRKGFDVLLRACAELPEGTGVYFIGGEPTEEYLGLTAQYHLRNVHFVSYLDKETLNRYYSAADVFVLPTRYDIWGLVVNEAMARGLPVITTKTCIAGLELVEDGVEGYLYDKEDVRALAAKMNELLRDPELRARAAAAALRKIGGYTIEAMVRTHLAIFDGQRD